MHATPIRSYFPPPPRRCRRIVSTSSASSLPPWTVSDISKAINGEIIKWGPPGTITTDTRSLNPNQPHWFLPLTGQNFNGHDFITPELHTKGCVGVIGARVCKNWNWGFIKLHDDDKNTLIALEKLAIYARSRFKGEVVGITGSVGKTTTKEMVTLIGGGGYHGSYENQNNEIGVGLTLIGISGDVEVVVVEMGMRRKGEILKLSEICRPSIGVILNVEASHLVNFGCLEEIANAKGEILRGLKPGDVCVLNGDDPLVSSLDVPDGVKKVFFGRRLESDMRLVSAENTDGGCGVRVVLESNNERVEFVIQSPGLHLAVNACAAAAVSVQLGVSLPQIARSLSTFKPVHMRAELTVVNNSIKIINDAYNANPSSTKAAISLLKAINCNGRRIAILGDMLELGPTEVEAHKAVLSLCYVDRSIDLVVIVGKIFVAAAEKLTGNESTEMICMPDAETLAVKVAGILYKGDVVLVKGSRGMQMEKVVDAIKAISVDSKDHFSPC